MRPRPIGKFRYGGSPQMTQIEQARAGTVTPEMAYVAQREGLEPELVREKREEEE